MTNASSATAQAPVDWSVDNRGYIHGGFDTPIFGAVKQKHNARLTSRKNKLKRTTSYGIMPEEEAQRLSFSENRKRVDQHMSTLDLKGTLNA